MMHRRLTPRAFAIAAVLLTVVLCLYYASFTSEVPNNSSGQSHNRADISSAQAPYVAPKKKKTLNSMCPKLPQSHADIDTVQIYKDFDFQVSASASERVCDISIQLITRGGLNYNGCNLRRYVQYISSTALGCN